MYFSVGYTTPTLADAFSSWRIPPNGCCNPMGYNNPDVDKRFAEAQAEFDQAKQDGLMAKALGTASGDSPLLFIVHDLNLRVLSPKVRGFIMAQAWYADLKNVWVNK
jgi:peptide/nickel transport system substrate-binding protein